MSNTTDTTGDVAQDTRHTTGITTPAIRLNLQPSRQPLESRGAGAIGYTHAERERPALPVSRVGAWLECGPTSSARRPTRHSWDHRQRSRARVDRETVTKAGCISAARGSDVTARIYPLMLERGGVSRPSRRGYSRRSSAGRLTGCMSGPNMRRDMSGLLAPAAQQQAQQPYSRGHEHHSRPYATGSRALQHSRTPRPPESAGSGMQRGRNPRISGGDPRIWTVQRPDISDTGAGGVRGGRDG